jgi:hypothetical protein
MTNTGWTDVTDHAHRAGDAVRVQFCAGPRATDDGRIVHIRAGWLAATVIGVRRSNVHGHTVIMVSVKAPGGGIITERNASPNCVRA